MSPPSAPFGNLLSVPGAQGSAGHGRSHSFSSNGTSTWTGGSPSTLLGTSETVDSPIDGQALLKMDTGDTVVVDNPFAFLPRQLARLHDPKNLDVLRAMRGIIGLCVGLRTDVANGLSPDEDKLDGHVTLQDVDHAVETRKKAQVKADFIKKIPEDDRDIEVIPEEPQVPRRSTKRTFSLGSRRASPATLGSTKGVAVYTGFTSRKRIFGENRLPARKPKNIFQLMWMALHDKILVRPSFIRLT
jgi:Ca2+-transporting ATPase